MSTAILCVVAGIPASGKTTLANALSTAMGAPVVSRDVVRRELFPTRTYETAEKEVAFRAVLVVADALLAAGTSCIVEGMPFSRDGELEAAHAVAEKRGVRCLSIVVDTPVEVAEKRLESTYPTHVTYEPSSDRRPGLAREVALRMRAFPDTVLLVDGTASVDRNVEIILTIIEGFSL